MNSYDTAKASCCHAKWALAATPDPPSEKVAVVAANSGSWLCAGVQLSCRVSGMETAGGELGGQEDAFPHPNIPPYGHVLATQLAED